MKLVLEKIILSDKDREILNEVLKKEVISMEITMCQGLECPLKHKCWRYMAKPDEYQAYFMPPYKDDDCEYFMRIPKGHKVDRDKLNE